MKCDCIDPCHVDVIFLHNLNLVIIKRPLIKVLWMYTDIILSLLEVPYKTEAPSGGSAICEEIVSLLHGSTNWLKCPNTRACLSKPCASNIIWNHCINNSSNITYIHLLVGIPMTATTAWFTAGGLGRGLLFCLTEVKKHGLVTQYKCHHDILNDMK